MIRSRATKALVLSSGNAATALVAMLSAAVLARTFSLVDYASFRQTMLAYAFAVPFVTLGFDRGLYSLLPGREARAKGVLVENLVWLLAGGVLLSSFLLFGGGKLLASRFNNPGLAPLLLLLIPYPLFMLPASALPACLMARDRAGQVALFGVTSRLLLFLAVVVPSIIWPFATTAVVGTVIGAAVATAIALWLMFRSCHEGSGRPTRAGLLEQAQFCVPLGLAGIAGTASLTLDQILVSSLTSPAEFAVYVNGAFEVPLVGTITGAITSVLLADYARLLKENRRDEVVALMGRAMTKSAIVIFPAMVFLLAMAEECMTALFGEKYGASAIPFRLYLLMLPVRILSFGAVLQAAGRSRVILTQAILSLSSNAVLLWIAIRGLGPLFAPIGPVLSLYLLVVPFLVRALSKTLECPIGRLFPWRDLALLAGASAAGVPALLVVRHAMRGGPDLAVLTVGGLAYVGITAGVFVYFGWHRTLAIAGLWNRRL